MKRKPLPYVARLLRPVRFSMDFADWLTGELVTTREFELDAGLRQFRTIADRDYWIADMNNRHGAGTAAL